MYWLREILRGAPQYGNGSGKGGGSLQKWEQQVYAGSSTGSDSTVSSPVEADNSSEVTELQGVLLSSTSRSTGRADEAHTEAAEGTEANAKDSRLSTWERTWEGVEETLANSAAGFGSRVQAYIIPDEYLSPPALPHSCKISCPLDEPPLLVDASKPSRPHVVRACDVDSIHLCRALKIEESSLSGIASN
mmetsp:Transcript_148348/g.413258  ORF Transcript_148348/g.413258 Transcript_148348/m.413258 type:complete len:190 (-) Transcript_148348:213-782(-)